MACLGVALAVTAVRGGPAAANESAAVFGGGLVPKIEIEVAAPGMKVLRDYHQQNGAPRPERVDVPAVIREGGRLYTNVLIHLKGSWSFQPVDRKPSFTLKFEKGSGGERFHGLEKIHLNNSAQDPTFLCEAVMRSLLNDLGVPSPRAGHALVSLNGRPLGLYVLVEGWNKQFLKRHFAVTSGNLYDGGSGGDVTKALKVDSGDDPEDRSDLKALVQAAQEKPASARFARLAEVLDIDRFLTFIATESLFVHWDGYSLSANNYRVFHDAGSGRMVFMPHGMDQLFGVSRSPEMPIHQPMKGLVARSLVSTREGKQRFDQRLQSLATNQLRADAVVARMEQIAAPVRRALAEDEKGLRSFNHQVRVLRGRIEARMASVAAQLGEAPRPAEFGVDGVLRLRGWEFRAGPAGAATGEKQVNEGHETLKVAGGATTTAGSWRRRILLAPGRYTFAAQAYTSGVPPGGEGVGSGVLVRRSGERETSGLKISEDWSPLHYDFELAVAEEVELICEFRGHEGAGYFYADSLHLIRKPPAAPNPK